MIDTLVLQFSWPFSLLYYLQGEQKYTHIVVCCVEKFIDGEIYKDWVGSILAWDCRLANSRVKQSDGKKYSVDKTFEICQDLKQKRAESKLGRSEYNGLSWGKRYVVGLYYSF